MHLIDNIQSFFASQHHSKRRYLLAYTILFFFLTFTIYLALFVTGRSFIWINDGYAQHYTSYVYWGRYLRGIIKGVFSGNFNLPEWDFALGEGNDVLQTMQFYALGDPFAWLSVFCPDRFTHIFYTFSVILRVYLAGLAFSALASYVLPDHSRYGRLVGSLTYSFSIWSIANITRHPFFLNPLILFPLIILGIEKIIREKKPTVYILSVFLAAISNFYYFYILVLMTATVIIVLLIYRYRSDLKKLFKTLLSLALYSLLAGVMAGVILLPTMYAFLSDSRMGLGTTLRLFYPFSYYEGLVGNIFGNAWDYWLCIGLAAPTIIAVIYLLANKKNSILKCFLAISAIVTLLPVFGQILNGMSYMTNRWSWACGLLASFILALTWKDLFSMSKRDIRIISVVLGISGVIMLIFEPSRTVSAFAGLGCTCLVLLILYFLKKRRSRKRASLILLAISMISIIAVRVLWVIPEEHRFSLKKYSAFSNDYHFSKDATRQAEADGFDNFYRAAENGSVRRWNDHTLFNVSSPGYYWSISNPATSEFLKEMEIVDGLAQQHWGIDNKSIIMTTGSLRYYTVLKDLELPAPYGFVPAESETADIIDRNGYTMYKNENALPFGYFITNRISDDQWNSLSALQKQEALLQGVYLRNYPSSEEGVLSLKSEELDSYVFKKSDNVTIKDNAIVVEGDAESAFIVYGFGGIPNSETSIHIKNLNYTKPDNVSNSDAAGVVTLSFINSADEKYSITYATPNYTFYNDQHDFLRDIGYHEESIGSVYMRFSAPGTYSFDSLSFLALPMDDYEAEVSAIQANAVTEKTIDHDLVECSYNAESDGYLRLSIPYAAGWTAYVDDKEVPIYQADIRYIGLEISAGQHDIRLEYKTPYLRSGAVCSLAGFVIFMILIIIRRSRRKKNTVEE